MKDFSYIQLLIDILALVFAFSTAKPIKITLKPFEVVMLFLVANIYIILLSNGLIP